MEKILKLQPVETSAFAAFPIPTGSETEITYHTDRMTKKIQLTQFPLNVANTRTVHILQEGRSTSSFVFSEQDFPSKLKLKPTPPFVLFAFCSNRELYFERDDMIETNEECHVG